MLCPLHLSTAYLSYATHNDAERVQCRTKQMCDLVLLKPNFLAFLPVFNKYTSSAYNL
jgi:hypothetical protein